MRLDAGAKDAIQRWQAGYKRSLEPRREGDGVGKLRPFVIDGTESHQRWTELNRRQQRYLLAIFETDQDQEAHERGAFRRGERSRPAETWRWMRYATEGMPPTDTALKARIGAAKLVDQGTGSTFNALERRGYIICRYAGQSDSLVLDLKLTPAGRKLARYGAGMEAPRRPAAGQLREWQWTALAQLYVAGDAGITDEQTARISESSFRRLEDMCFIERGRGIVRISPAGELFYIQQHKTYRERYPQIDAPALFRPAPRAAPFPVIPAQSPISGLVGPNDPLINPWWDRPNVGTIVTLDELHPGRSGKRMAPAQLFGDWRQARPQLGLGIVYGVFAGWDAYRQRVSAMGHGTMLAVVDGAHQRFCWIGAAAQPDTLPVTLLERIWSSTAPRPQIRFSAGSCRISSASSCWSATRCWPRLTAACDS